MSAIKPLTFKVTFDQPDDLTKVGLFAVPAEVRLGLYARAPVSLWYATRVGALNAASRANRGGIKATVEEFELVPKAGSPWLKL